MGDPPKTKRFRLLFNLIRQSTDFMHSQLTLHKYRLTKPSISRLTDFMLCFEINFIYLSESLVKV